jgi:hypothetical protein
MQREIDELIALSRRVGTRPPPMRPVTPGISCLACGLCLKRQ